MVLSEDVWLPFSHDQSEREKLCNALLDTFQDSRSLIVVNTPIKVRAAEDSRPLSVRILEPRHFFSEDNSFSSTRASASELKLRDISSAFLVCDVRRLAQVEQQAIIVHLRASIADHDEEPKALVLIESDRRVPALTHLFYEHGCIRPLPLPSRDLKKIIAECRLEALTYRYIKGTPLMRAVVTLYKHFRNANLRTSSLPS